MQLPNLNTEAVKTLVGLGGTLVFIKALDLLLEGKGGACFALTVGATLVLGVYLILAERQRRSGG